MGFWGKMTVFLSGLTAIGAFLTTSEPFIDLFRDGDKVIDKIETTQNPKYPSNPSNLSNEAKPQIDSSNKQNSSETTESTPVKSAAVTKEKKNEKLTHIINGFPKNNPEYKEFSLLVSSKVASASSLKDDIQAAIESSLLAENYEPKNPFNESLTSRMIDGWVASRNTTIENLVDYLDYIAFATYGIGYKNSNSVSSGRMTCTINLNLQIVDLQTKRSIYRSNEDFNGIGVDNDQAYQNALNQIENFIFIKQK